MQIEILHKAVQHRPKCCIRNRKAPQEGELYSQQGKGLHHRIILVVPCLLQTLLCHQNTLRKGLWNDRCSRLGWLRPSISLWSSPCCEQGAQLDDFQRFLSRYDIKDLSQKKVCHFLKILNFLLKFAFVFLSLGSALVSQYKSSLLSLLRLHSEVLNGFS